MAKQGYAPWTEEADLTLSENLSDKKIDNLVEALVELADRKHQLGSEGTTERQKG